MTISTIQKNNIWNKSTYKVEAAVETFDSEETWVRNPAWLTLPEVTATEQKFVGLYAVDPHDSLLRLVFDLDVNAADPPNGTYTVDWGDGTVETFNDNASAEHTYNFDNTELDNTDGPVTFTDATNLVTRTNHGYTNGMRISFAKITTTTGIDQNVAYYVINATTDTFQLSETSGGSAIDLVNDGTGKILAYKQAIVTVTSNWRILTANFALRHSSVTTSTSALYTSGWLDISMSFPWLTLIYFSTYNGSSAYIHNARLEQAKIYNLGYVTSANRLFFNNVNLRSVPVLNLPDTLITTTFLFSGCRTLTTIPDNLNLVNVQDASYMFQACHNLQYAPEMNTSAVLNMTGMFENCFALRRIPFYNTSNCYAFTGMFQNCYNLVRIPELNFSGARFMGATFAGCNSIETLPFLDTKKCTDFNTCFAYCFMLKEIQHVETSNAIYTHNMFLQCHSLEKVPKMDVRNVVSAYSMFSQCYSLQEVSGLVFEKVQIAYNMFYFCNSLTRADILVDSPNLQRTDSMFSNCYSLEKVPQIGSISKVIYSYNMFAGCYRLTEVPDYDLPECINAASMYSGCVSLEKAPKLTLPKVTNASNMFTSCHSLLYCPNYDLPSCTNISAMFYQCYSLVRAPRINAPLTTTFYRLFRDCYNVEYVPNMPSANVTTVQEMFYNCNSLREVSAFDLGSVATTTNYIYAGSSIYRYRSSNLSVSFSVANCKLSANALNEIYTNLPNASATITVTGNWGVANDDPTIATNKGWTVTG